MPSSLSEQSNIYILTDNLFYYTNQTLVNSFRNLVENSLPSNSSSTWSLLWKPLMNLNYSRIYLEWMPICIGCVVSMTINTSISIISIDFSPAWIHRNSITSAEQVSPHDRKFPNIIEPINSLPTVLVYVFSRPVLEKLRPYVNKTIFPSGCLALPSIRWCLCWLFKWIRFEYFFNFIERSLSFAFGKTEYFLSKIFYRRSSQCHYHRFCLGWLSTLLVAHRSSIDRINQSWTKANRGNSLVISTKLRKRTSGKSNERIRSIV